MERSTVPCNGCTACCRRELLILHPQNGDDPATYETVECTDPLTGKPAVALKHKPDGDCIYLDAEGCTIWDRAPTICKAFDCRRFYVRMTEGTTRKERRRPPLTGILKGDVARAGRARLHTLGGFA